MLRKLNKHKKIISRRFKEHSEIQRIKSFDNSSLSDFISSYQMVKAGQHSKEDLLRFNKCETYRNQLLKNHSTISYEIFGLDTVKTVRQSALASSTKPWAQLLYYLAKKTQRGSVLEIGTNLGVSGSYILEAIKDKVSSHLVTMEGLPQSCKIASAKFETITDKDQFNLIQGLYDKTFPLLIKESPVFDLLFIDGNHQEKPTIEYFHTLKKHIHNPAIFIFDDINWSEGMKKAWSTIQRDEDVNFSIDLYRWGVVIIDNKDPNRNVDFALHLTY